jgi:hypothetical protein
MVKKSATPKKDEKSVVPEAKAKSTPKAEPKKAVEEVKMAPVNPVESDNEV